MSFSGIRYGNIVSVNSVSDDVARHGARVLSLIGFCVRGFDRSFDVTRIISHLVHFECKSACSVEVGMHYVAD